MSGIMRSSAVGTCNTFRYPISVNINPVSTGARVSAVSCRRRHLFMDALRPQCNFCLRMSSKVSTKTEWWNLCHLGLASVWTLKIQQKQNSNVVRMDLHRMQLQTIFSLSLSHSQWISLVSIYLRVSPAFRIFCPVHMPSTFSLQFSHVLYFTRGCGFGAWNTLKWNENTRERGKNQKVLNVKHNIICFDGKFSVWDLTLCTLRQLCAARKILI